ncbi:hypothetical protein NP233_g4164 [Leucocoprinus birnbaumii]|uniref:AB hydrolase-1 domain-containing protein n=1 Tax=Leucocoprinus birnbaumii TaxID=56174 RepID=A0AAD5VV71_9AGAR|nr:hypothetical protein NP233_g4164 [Leucocoprinus birnbaumii]
MSDLRPTEGAIDFNFNGEKFQTYYKVFGSISDRVKDPLIALHGGPGLVHENLLYHSDLAVKHNIPVILYDQLGNGKSTHLKDKPKDFWNIALFVEELENLVRHFDIQAGFNILGHSWGGILGAEFEVRKQLPGLKHLILTNSLASFGLWTQSVVQLLQEFPEEVKQGVLGGMSDPPRYRAALKKFHAVHGCIVKPQPYEFTYTLDQVFGEDGDPTVAGAKYVICVRRFNIMLNWDSILQEWSIIDRLHLVRAPTLVINGRKDIAQDFVVQPFFDKIQRVKWVTLENSSHTPFFEERDRYMDLVANFLQS